MSARPNPLVLVKSRIAVAAALCAFAFAMVGARLVEVMVLRAQTESVQVAAEIRPVRTDLVDRNGALIARDLPVSDVYATPAAFWDTDDAAFQLSRALGADEARLATLFARKAGYILVHRGLTPDKRSEIMSLGLPGLVFENDFKRYYPSGRTIAHAVGQVDADEKGVSGLELGLDKQIREAEAPVKLSFDMRVQYALQHELVETSRAFQTVASAGLVMNIQTGEVLALASLPDYEPNMRELSEGDSIRNRMTQDVYELGSIFKIFTFAQAIEEKTVGLDEMIDISTPLKFGRYSIGDYDDHGHALTAAMVLAESSNIGTAKIAARAGPERQRAFLERLGLLSPLKTEVPEMASPLIPRQWGEIEGATISFGHGLSVNPLAFAAAAAAIVNGGTKLTPTFVKSDAVQQGERVVSETTSIEMRKLLRLVVTDGTGSKAEAEGYEVGGKTGTAEKPIGRSYSKNRQITSFVGIFPSSDPKYLVFTLFDEPKGNKESFGFATAGWTAAPAVGRVIARIAPLLGVPRREPAPEPAIAAIPAPAPGIIPASAVAPVGAFAATAP
jgi:cell division protein FtsI (penicillin-binding protein 3)